MFTRKDRPRALLTIIRRVLLTGERTLSRSLDGPDEALELSHGANAKLAISIFNEVREVMDDYETILPTYVQSTRDAIQEADDLVERS